MKVGDWVIYDGKNFPKRVGQKALIISFEENWDYDIWNLQFEDGFKHSCREDFLEPYYEKKKKVRNPEVDPFDEEKWGYVQEQVGERFFKVGDIVKINRHKVPESENDKVYYAKSKGGEGEIFEIIPSMDRHPYRVRWKLGNPGFEQGRYAEDELELVNDRRKRVRKPDEDPFDEEHWGFVQEARGDNFIPGETILYKGQRANYYGQTAKIIESIPSSLNCKIEFQDGNQFLCGITYLTRIDGKGINRKKITKPDIDPFGEESWYSVQENSNRFIPESSCILIHKYKEIGNLDDYFEYVKNLVLNKKISYVSADDYNNRNYMGVVTDIKPRNFEEGGIGISLKLQEYPDYHIVSVYSPIVILEESGKKYRRLEQPEIDPFGEETWGYVQESFSCDDDVAIYVKNKNEYDKLMRELEMDGFLWAGGERPTNSVEYDKYREVLYLNLYDKKTIVYSDLPFFVDGFKNQYKNRNYRLIRYGEDSNKKYKKLEKPEIDPFGEETWGYVQESAEYVGNRFYVTDKLDYYIEKYGWNRSMKNLIGTKIIPNKFSPNYEFSSDLKIDVCSYDGWSIPADCLLPYKKITKPDIDPFGEEIW